MIKEKKRNFFFFLDTLIFLHCTRMSDNEGVTVHIRERLDEDADYERPAICKSIKNTFIITNLSKKENTHFLFSFIIIIIII